MTKKLNWNHAFPKIIRSAALPCENCSFWDNSNHKDHFQTRDSGICQKHMVLTFRSQGCDNHFNKEGLPDWEQLEAYKRKEVQPTFQQQKLFQDDMPF